MTSMSVTNSVPVPDIDNFYITTVESSPASVEGWEGNGDDFMEEEGESGVDEDDDDDDDDVEAETDAQAHELLYLGHLDDDEEGGDVPDQDPLSFQEDGDGASEVIRRLRVLAKGEDQVFLGDLQHSFLDPDYPEEDTD